MSIKYNYKAHYKLYNFSDFGSEEIFTRKRVKFTHSTKKCYRPRSFKVNKNVKLKHFYK